MEGKLIQERAGRMMVDRGCHKWWTVPLVIRSVMRSFIKSRQEKSIFVFTTLIRPCQGQKVAGKVILIIRRRRNFRI